MDKQGKVILEGLSFYGYHGVHPFERLVGNKFEIDIAVSMHLDEGAFHDEIEGTIDYKSLYAIAKEEFEKTQKKLMEPIAYSIAKRVLNTFDKVIKANVAVSKFAPSIGGTCKRARIEVNLGR